MPPRIEEQDIEAPVVEQPKEPIPQSPVQFFRPGEVGIEPGDFRPRPYDGDPTEDGTGNRYTNPTADGSPALRDDRVLNPSTARSPHEVDYVDRDVHNPRSEATEEVEEPPAQHPSGSILGSNPMTPEGPSKEK